MSNYKNRRAAASSESQPSAADRAVDHFTEMMITRMEALKAGDWKKGWTNGQASVGFPQNLQGRTYSGTNSFFLQLDTAMHGYVAPVYLTFKKAKEAGLSILKGSTSMPVVYWDLNIRDASGRRVAVDTFRQMTAAEQKQCDVHPFMKAYHVFNIDQTNIREVSREKYDQLMAQFAPMEIRDRSGMYENPALDRMFQRQEWLCPIQSDQLSTRAYYSPKDDRIVVPMKEQFNISATPGEVYKDGMEYYSSALHEMSHSTGAENRLNRTKGDHFGDSRYAKEELVAELTAAMVGNALGFDARILDNNAAYLDSWISALKQEPRFIVSVMADVNKASAMILEQIDRQKLALGEQPILSAHQSKGEDSPAASLAATATQPQPAHDDPSSLQFSHASVFKLKDGGYAVRASYGGTPLAVKPLDLDTAQRFTAQPDGQQKSQALQHILAKTYAADVARISAYRHRMTKV